MPTSDDGRNEPAQPPQGGRPPDQSKKKSIFDTPAPIERLFQRFPLITYATNELPLRSPRDTPENVLYIFTTPSDALRGEPSFNPSCLKWQAYLKFHDISFTTAVSSNHASPSGALPFLLPASAAPTSNNPSDTPQPIPSTKLEAWIYKAHPQHDPTSRSTRLRHAPYHTLLTTHIRVAYLYALYLTPSTFRTAAAPLYIHPASSNALVRLSLSYPLRAAALSEVLAASSAVVPTIAVERLIKDAEEAFSALSIFLGDREWFESIPTEVEGDRTADEAEPHDDSPEQYFRTHVSGETRPGMLDAAVFAYTHVMLTIFSRQEEGSPARRLVSALRGRHNLCRHRNVILKKYFR